MKEEEIEIEVEIEMASLFFINFYHTTKNFWEHFSSLWSILTILFIW